MLALLCPHLTVVRSPVLYQLLLQGPFLIVNTHTQALCGKFTQLRAGLHQKAANPHTTTVAKAAHNFCLLGSVTSDRLHSSQCTHTAAGLLWQDSC